MAITKKIEFNGDVLHVAFEEPQKDAGGGDFVAVTAWDFADPAQAERHRAQFLPDMKAADVAKLDAIKVKLKL